METDLDKLIREINEVIDNNRKNFSINYAEAIGALELIKADLVAEAVKD